MEFSKLHFTCFAHKTLRACRHAMELFVQLVNLYFDEDVSRQINRAFAEEAVLLPIKFTACRTKFVLFKAARCLALIYLIQAFIIHKRTTTFILHQNLTGRNLFVLAKKIYMEFVSTMKLAVLDQIRRSSGDFYLIRCFFKSSSTDHTGILVEFIWLVVSIHVCSRFET